MSVIRTSADVTVMVVFWNPLTYSEARGFVSHYTVAYSPQASNRKRQMSNAMKVTVSGMESYTTTIDSLDPNTLYGVQVSATTGGGEGEYSLLFSVPVPATVKGIVMVV